MQHQLEQLYTFSDKSMLTDINHSPIFLFLLLTNAAGGLSFRIQLKFTGENLYVSRPKITFPQAIQPLRFELLRDIYPLFKKLQIESMYKTWFHLGVCFTFGFTVLKLRRAVLHKYFSNGQLIHD